MPFYEHADLIAKAVCDGTNDRDSWLFLPDEIVWLEQRGFTVTRLNVAGEFTYCRLDISPAGAVLYMMQQANPEV